MSSKPETERDINLLLAKIEGDDLKDLAENWKKIDITMDFDFFFCHRFVFHLQVFNYMEGTIIWPFLSEKIEVWEQSVQSIQPSIPVKPRLLVEVNEIATSILTRMKLLSQTHLSQILLFLNFPESRLVSPALHLHSSFVILQWLFYIH